MGVAVARSKKLPRSKTSGASVGPVNSRTLPGLFVVFGEKMVALGSALPPQERRDV